MGAGVGGLTTGTTAEADSGAGRAAAGKQRLLCMLCIIQRLLPAGERQACTWPDALQSVRHV